MIGSYDGNIIPDILVYATHYKIEENVWGYKWVGFCYGKRFVVMEDPCKNKIDFNSEEGIYVFTKNEEQNLLPTAILKLTHSSPLSNEYFSLRIGKEKSIEIIMSLIEEGYDIEKDIVCYKHEKCPYRVCEKTTGNILVEMTEDAVVVWSEKSDTEQKNMEDVIYLQLYKNLVTLFKKDRDITIDIVSKKNRRFRGNFSGKVQDVNMEDDYIYVEFDGGSVEINIEDTISYFAQKERIFKDIFQIKSEEFIIRIDTSEHEE